MVTLNNKTITAVYIQIINVENVSFRIEKFIDITENGLYNPKHSRICQLTIVNI